MLRKTLIAGLFVALALMLAAPALVGAGLARYHELYVERLAVPGVLEVTGAEFARGWFTSRSRIRLRPAPALCAAAECPGLVLASVFHHGPLPLTAPAEAGGLRPARGVIVSRLDPSPLLPAWRFEPALPELVAITRVAPGGGLHTRGQLPAARLTARSQGRELRVSSHALTLSSQAGTGHSSIEADLAWPRIEVGTEDEARAVLRGLSAQVRGDGGPPGFAGRYRIAFEGLELDGAAGTTTTLQGAVWQVRAEPAGPQLASGDFELRLSRAASGTHELGPVILDGRYGNLDLEALAALQRELARLEGRSLPPGLAAAAMAGVYREHLPAVLAAGPSLDIRRFLVGTEHGDVLGDGSLTVAGADGDGGLAALSQRVRARLDLRLPVPLVEAAATQALAAREGGPAPGEPAFEADRRRLLSRLEEAGVLAPEPAESAYRVELRLEEGALTINGNTRERWGRLLQPDASGTPD